MPGRANRIGRVCRLHLAPLMAVAAAIFLVYAPMFRMRTFGPELPLFYQYNEGRSLVQTLSEYRNFAPTWYRPTSFHLPYWLGQQVLSWYNTAGWQAMEAASLAVTCCAVYWFVLLLAPGRRLAATLAALYFGLHPAFYPAIVSVSSFDLPHVLFTIVCVGCFIRALAEGGRARVAALAASWLCFVAALTSKEVAVAIPAYLAVAAAILTPSGGGASRWLGGWGKRVCLVAPFLAVLPYYWSVHLAGSVRSLGNTGIYRGGFSAEAVLTNLHDLVQWTARIYYHTSREPGHGSCYDTFAVNGAGAVLTVLVAVCWWRHAARDERSRQRLYLMLAWMAVFLALPVYGGGFLWHASLPATGLAVLFGLAVAAWVESLAPGWPRRAVLVALVLALAVLSRANLQEEIAEGVHSRGFRLNASVREHPPVPRERLGPAPLVYVEDRMGYGEWSYGCLRWLFDYVYQRHDVEQVVVPRIEAVPAALREQWLRHPNAYFFRYDDGYRWYDDSERFRRWPGGL
jgi:hypothetical protein